MKHLINYSSYPSGLSISDDFPRKIKSTLEKVKNSDRDTPLKRLLNSQVTTDGRFMLMGGQIIDMNTGRERPVFENHGLKFQPMEFPYFGNNKKINEEWSWGESSLNPSNWTVSGVLHGVADVASVAADFVVPGSGALIDAANAISYVIEAQFTDSEEEKETLYIMAAVTGAFILIPWIPAGALKAWIKGGGEIISKPILELLKAVWMMLDALIIKLPAYLYKTLASPAVRKILGKNADKASAAISRFTTKIKSVFTNFLKKRGVKLGEPLPASAVKAGGKGTAKAGGKAAAKKGASKAASAFAKKLAPFKKGPEIMAKSGFKQGKTYRYVLKIGGKTTVGKATINNISKSGVEVSIKYSSGRTVTRLEPVETFMLRAVVKPFLDITRFTGGKALVPLFVKRFVDVIFDDGTVDEEALMKMEDLNPDVVAQESEALGAEIAQYEGDSGSYSVSEVVDSVQTALGSIDVKYKNIMSDNGRLEDPFDGKFGPLTKAALTKFQEDSKIEATGKMDLRTVKAIVDKLGIMRISPELIKKLQEMMPKDQSNLGLDLMKMGGSGQAPAKPQEPQVEKPKDEPQPNRFKMDVGKI